MNVTDKASDPTGYASRDDLMRQLLTPNHIAIIGASPRPTSAGFMLLQNLNIFGFRGKISLINPKYQAIGDRTCIPAITEMTQTPELCVIALPAARAVAAVEDAMRAGVKTFVLFAGGFAEQDQEGIRAQARLSDLCASNGALLCGPNTLGNAALKESVTSSFATMWLHEERKVGKIAIISQSGALLCTTYALAVGQGAGFSHAISVGNEAVLDVVDYVDYLDRMDSASRIFCIYYERIRRPYEFIRLCHRLRMNGKRVLILRGGRLEAGAKAAVLHTGAVASDNAVEQSFLAEAGVMFVRSPRELANTAAAISCYEFKRFGKRVAVLASSGGGAVAAADAAEEAGLEVVSLQPQTVLALKTALALPSVANPLDVSAAGFHQQDIVSGAVKELDSDVGVDEIVGCCVTPASVSHDFVRGLLTGLAGRERPGIVICEDLPKLVHDAQPKVFMAEGITDGFQLVARLASALNGESQSYLPTAFSSPIAPQSDDETAIQFTNTLLEVDVYGRCPWLPIPKYALVESVDAACSAARRLGFPIAVKAISGKLLHRKLLGLVCLDIQDEESLERRYADLDLAVSRLDNAGPRRFLIQKMAPRGTEVIMGIRHCVGLGYVIAVGRGGTGAGRGSLLACGLLPLSAGDRDRLAQVVSRELALSVQECGALADGVRAITRAWRELGGPGTELEFNPMVLTGQTVVIVDALGSQAAGRNDGSWR